MKNISKIKDEKEYFLRCGVRYWHYGTYIESDSYHSQLFIDQQKVMLKYAKSKLKNYLKGKRRCLKKKRKKTSRGCARI